ncbi:MAG: transglutaminase-like domain-containing protein, partial [Pseudomonadota bacterium]
ADEMAATLAQAGGELPEEVFEATILKTGVRLPEPRRLAYLELELTHRNPSMGWPDLNSAHQRVLSQEADRLVLAIEQLEPRQSVPFHAEVSSELDQFLSANSVLQTAQPELIEMAQSITEGQTDRWQAALALRRWVTENMSFDAGVVLASSSEVLENRRGTCTEFAVLLTALSRAAGIPARYVQGYVYAHGMLAGHAWTEVRIGEDWIALDAAIPSEGAADAARFAFVWSDFNDGPGELSAGASLQMFGQIDARVISWRVAEGAEQRFPDGAPVPQVADGRFVDQIQGIEWSVPEAWTVVDYQKTWPSNLIAAVEHPDGQRFELRWISQNPWERAGIDWIQPRVADTASVEVQPFGRSDSWLIEHGDRFRFVQAGSDGHWQLTGDDRERLRELASGLSLPNS